MRCPTDKSDMIVVEYQKIELDFCQSCSGVWFDSGELNLLLGATKEGGASFSQDNLLTPQPAKVNEARRKCPICGRKMDKVWIGKEPRVLIDSCQIGHGLWFDGEELHQVLRQVEVAGLEDVMSFLGNAFEATYKAEPAK
jgi:Zn-finger nucleic acid-binding protein